MGDQERLYLPAARPVPLDVSAVPTLGGTGSGRARAVAGEERRPPSPAPCCPGLPRSGTARPGRSRPRRRATRSPPCVPTPSRPGSRSPPRAASPTARQVPPVSRLAPRLPIRMTVFAMARARGRRVPGRADGRGRSACSRRAAARGRRQCPAPKPSPWQDPRAPFEAAAGDTHRGAGRAHPLLRSGARPPGQILRRGSGSAGP